MDGPIDRRPGNTDGAKGVDGGDAPTSESASPATVLLVEDDPALSGTLAKYLAAHQHHITIAPSAEEAAHTLRAGLRPDVVLLDINLPGESGWQFLRSGILASAGDPPVFILSAIHIAPARLREFGCAGYLPKPFAVSTLLEIVERHRGTGPGAAGPAVAAGPGSGAGSYGQNGGERTFEDELAFGDGSGWPGHRCS